MANNNPPEQTPVQHLDVHIGSVVQRRGLVRRHPFIAGGVALSLVAGAVGAYNYFSDEGGVRERHDVKEVEQGITQYDAGLSTCVGGLSTHISMKMNVNTDMHFKIPVINKKPGRTQTTTYEGEFPADVKFCYQGTGKAKTKRADETTPPLPTDTVEVEIDKGTLFADRGRLNLIIEPEVTTVANGYITKRNGKPVVEPQRIFARDGEFTSGQYKVPPGDSAWDDLAEGVVLGKIDIGKNAIRNMHVVAQVLASNPQCIQTAFDAVPPEVLTETAVKDYYVLQGYTRSNVRVNYKEDSKWPTTDEMKDENGATFRDKMNEVENKLPGSQKIKVATTCQPGNLSNTANAPQQSRDISPKVST